MQVTRHHSCWVSPFGNPRINARLTAPRGISQPPTSFIGSRCQGIHHAPLNTYLHTKTKEEITHFDELVSPEGLRVHLDARNHYPILKHHTPPPRWGDSTRFDRVLSQCPIVCLAIICCCAPGFRPLQTRTPHGSHTTNWCAFRGAP